MLVTPSGIEIVVNPEQPEKAQLSIVVTGHPTRTEGTLIDPVVVVGIAADHPGGHAPIDAVLSDSENFHSTPSTTSVSALTAEIKKAKLKGGNHFMF